MARGLLVRAAMQTNLRSVAVMLALAGALLGSRPAAAQECARDIDDTGRLVDTLRDLLGVDGRGSWGPLAARIDPAVLAERARTASPRERARLAGEMLALLADDGLARKRECDGKRIRYNAAALLAELVGNSTKAERAKLFACLLEAAQKEKDPELRRQLLRDLWRLRASAGATAGREADALIEEILPSRPPYETIFGKDGEKTDVNVRMHTAAEIFRGSHYIGHFRSLGAKIDRHSPTDVTIHYTVTPDDPTGKYKPVTYHIRMTDDFKDDWENFDVFSDMDSSDPAIEMYDFHSQYGNGLDGSLAKAPSNPDAKKLYFIAACKSKVFAEGAASLYPKTHFITTKDGEYFSDTPYTLAHLLDELANRSTYRQIHRTLAADDLTNYHLPNDATQLAYTDADDDGIADATDGKLDCGLKQAPQKDDFTAKAPASDYLELDGRKVLRGVTVANGLIGYNTVMGPAWEDKFVARGYAPADPDGPVAVITPSKDARGRKRWDVRVNAAYIHLSDEALAFALTQELGLYAASNGKPARATREEKIRAYETAVDLISAWDPDGEMYDAFQAKYNDLGKNLPFSFAVNALDKHDGATAATITKVSRYLDR